MPKRRAKRIADWQLRTLNHRHNARIVKVSVRTTLRATRWTGVTRTIQRSRRSRWASAKGSGYPARNQNHQKDEHSVDGGDAQRTGTRSHSSDCLRRPAPTMVSKLSSVLMIVAALFGTSSAPAMPTSARARTGVSLTPSAIFQCHYQCHRTLTRCVACGTI